MQYHQFPETDLSVSKLCFGCWGVISDAHWGTRAEEESLSAMRAAIEAGVNFFDTAPMYGNGTSEELLGSFLSKSELRPKTIVATKIRPDRMRPEQVLQECEDSLQRLKTDYIDLYQTHWTNRDVPLEDTWAAMRKLQEQGKVRHIGICNAGIQDMSTVSQAKPPLTNQLPYNLLWRAIEHDILPTCIQQNIGILVYSPLMHGILADNYKTAAEVPDGRARTRHFSSERAQTRHGESGCEQETFATVDAIRQVASELGRSMADVALAWLIQQPGVSSVIAGARNAEQLRANVAFVDAGLDSAVTQQLKDATDGLKETLGTNPDMWDGSGNGRYL